MVSQVTAPAQVEPLTTFEQNCLTTLATQAEWLLACQPHNTFVVSPHSFYKQASATELRIAGVLAHAALPYASTLTEEGKARILATWGPRAEVSSHE